MTAAAKRALPSSCQKRGARGPHATRNTTHTLSLSLLLFSLFSHSLSTRFVIAVYSTISRHASPRLPCFFDRTGNVVLSRDAFRANEIRPENFAQFIHWKRNLENSLSSRENFYGYRSMRGLVSNRKRLFGGREVETGVEIIVN